MRRAARLGFVAGLVAIVVGLSKVHAAWVAERAYDYTGSFRFGWSLLLIAVLGVVSYGLGLPDLPRTRRSALVTSAVAGALAATAISLVQLVTGDALLPRFVVALSVVLVVPLGVAANELARRGSARAERRDRVVLVGSLEDLTVLRADLEASPLKPAAVVAHLEVAQAAAPGGAHLLDEVASTEATVVVLARAALVDDRVVAQAASLHERGVRVRTLSLFYEEWLGKIPVSELERVSLLFDIGELHRARYGRTKRIIDVAIGALALAPLAVVMAVVAVANLVGNRGPLLYRQPRVGRFGHEFTIYKLRTMRPDAGDGAPTEWTAERDPRVTPLGRVLRASHLDELPQVINILRGDLSVVGPRPEQPRYVTELSEKLPFYRLRHLVRPGLTGWAQVMYGYAGDESDALEKLQYEFFYLRHQDMRFDMRIIGRTVRSVLGSQGRGR